MELSVDMSDEDKALMAYRMGIDHPEPLSDEQKDILRANPYFEDYVQAMKFVDTHGKEFGLYYRTASLLGGPGRDEIRLAGLANYVGKLALEAQEEMSTQQDFLFGLAKLIQCDGKAYLKRTFSIVDCVRIARAADDLPETVRNVANIHKYIPGWLEDNKCENPEETLHVIIAAAVGSEVRLFNLRPSGTDRPRD